MANPDAAPRVGQIKARLPVQAASATANQVVGEAPFDATVTGVTFTPDAAVTGATATKRTFTLVNEGQTGAGTTVVATLDLVTGVNLTAFREQAFTLSAVAGATTVTAEDVLSVQEVVAGAGTANPGGAIEVTFTSR